MIKLEGKSLIINKDELITVIRDGKVSFVDGKSVRPPPSQVKIAANVQPVDGRDLLLVPENDRYKEQYYVWTDFEIRTNDGVERCGVRFQVQSVEVWGSFYQARIMRLDVGPNAKSP